MLLEWKLPQQQSESEERRQTACQNGDQQGQAEDSLVNIPPLAQELTEQLRNHRSAAQTSVGSPLCPIIIADVRRMRRNVDKAMYDPDHISIGPYHWINRELAMDSDKIETLGTVLAASRGTAVEVYIQELERLEVEARRCYAHSFGNISSREFVRMLLLDGCYLLVQFGVIGGGGESRNHVEGAEPSAAGSLKSLDVVRDVFYLAENQIPFFVLDKILHVSDRSAYAGDKIMWFVQQLLQRQKYSKAPPPALRPEPGNLLHLLHMHLQPTNPLSHTAVDVPDGKMNLGRWRTATEYHLFGVSFKPRPLDRENVRSILDVNLDSGTLEIPPLDIDAETWRILHNLTALEQSNPEVVGSHVTAYCVFMYQLAGTAADVELLSSKRIITHGLSDNGKVADRFAYLCKGIVFDLDDPHRNYLRAACQELEERFQSRVRRFQSNVRRSMPQLWHKYFDNPWLLIVLMVAAIELTCSVVQSVYAVLSYKQKA